MLNLYIIVGTCGTFFFGGICLYKFAPSLFEEPKETPNVIRRESKIFESVFRTSDSSTASTNSI